ERELLLRLGGVAVADGTERAHDAGTLGMVRVLGGLTTTLARADLALHRDRPRAVDDAGGEEREQCEDRRGRIASRAGHARRALDLVAVELRDAIGPLRERLGMRVRLLVPALVVLRI